MKIIILALTLALVALVPIEAVNFECVYGGDEMDTGIEVIQSSDLGYVIVGFTSSTPVPHYPKDSMDIYIIRTDSCGTLLWEKNYDFFGVTDMAGSIRQTSDGGYIVAGSVLFKIDSIGDIIWVDYSITKISRGNSLAQTGMDTFVVVTDSFEAGYCWGKATKFTADDSIVWQRIFEGFGVLNVDDAGDGGIIISGVWRPPSPLCHPGMIRLDRDGNILWQTAYDVFDSYSSSVTKTGDGGYAMTSGGGETSIVVVKTDSVGEREWVYVCDWISLTKASDITYLSHGGYGIAGHMKLCDVCSDELLLLKISDDGVFDWWRIFDRGLGDYGYSVIQTNDFGFAITGLTWSIDSVAPSGDASVYLVKTDSLGNISWIREIPIKPQQIDINVFPNPFNSSCEINAPAEAKVEILDLRGNVVATPYASTGSASVPINKGGQNSSEARVQGVYVWTPDENVPSGVYLVRATTKDGCVATKRIVLVR